jgi:predicted DNA-binding protein with PD1-like motif
VQDTAPAAFGTAHVVRIAPNVDVCFALERFCREHGITAATIEGGVGSTVGAVFDDGRVVEPFVTELLIRHGEIRLGDDGEPRARIDIVMVDYLGGVSEGVLARGHNPVLVTFELVVQPLDA